MDFRHEILNMDLKNKQHSNSMTESEVCREIGITRSTMWRLSVGRSITIDTAVKIMNWTGKNVARYFN